MLISHAADDHLPAFGDPFDARGRVDRITVDVAIHALGHVAKVEADTERHSGGLDFAGLHESITQADRRTDRTIRAVEDGQDGIAQELDHTPARGVALHSCDALQLADDPQRQILVPRG